MKNIKRRIALSMAFMTALCGCSSGGGSSAENTAALTSNQQETASAESLSGKSQDREQAAEEAVTDFDFSELYGNDTIELTVFSQVANYSGRMTGWFAELMKKKYNCVINIIPDLNGAYETKMGSGALGDIIVFGTNGDQYRQAVKNGVLMDWNMDGILDEFGPYIKENMPYAIERNAKYSEEITGSNTVFGVSNNIASSSADHESFFYTWDIRWDLYDELGRPEIKDLDDYFELMLQMKSICPADENGNPTYAVSLWPDWDSNIVMYVNSFATAYWGYDGLPFGLYDLGTSEYYFSADADGPYMRSLRFFNRLYQAGLIDPDSMTQTYAKASEKVMSGGTFFSIFDYAGSKLYNTEEHISQNKMMLTLTPEEATPCAYGMNVRGGNRVFAIGAETAYPELCMAILNFLATPEGFLTYLYGPEELCWYYDESGHTCLTEFGEACYNSKDTTMMPDEWGGKSFKDGYFPINSSLWSIDATNPHSAGDTYNAVKWFSRQSEPRCELEKEWREYTGCKTADEYLGSRKYTVAVGTTYSESPRSDELKLVWEQVAQTVVSCTWRAIYAKDDAEFEKITDEMRKKCSEYDADGLLSEWLSNEAAYRKRLEEEVK